MVEALMGILVVVVFVAMTYGIFKILGFVD